MTDYRTAALESLAGAIPQDPAKLAAGLRETLTELARVKNERNRLFACCIETCVEEYSWDLFRAIEHTRKMMTEDTVGRALDFHECRAVLAEHDYKEHS